VKIFFTILVAFCNLLYGQEQNISEVLGKAFIYSPGNEPSVVFRKTLVIANDIRWADLNIFADSYYSLYINGNYVLNGPSRFDPVKPEYDAKEVKQFLHKGENLIAVLVYSGISNGMRMKHEAGLTLSLSGNGFTLLTDSSWKCSGQTRFKPPLSLWNGIKETIDASSEKGDCLSPSYDDSEWKKAGIVDGNKWGKLRERILPLLAERDIKPVTKLSLPSIADTLMLSFDKNYLINVGMKLEAEEGIKIKIHEFEYFTKNGIQEFRTFDSFGITDAKLPITSSAKIKILDIRFHNRVYPFELGGKFECSDQSLTKLWQISTHTLQQCTEDGYQDCPWERAEWMGDGAVIEYPLTRVAFIGEDKVMSDPRLIKKLLNDIALSQDSAGRLKAHHPSDRFDIHGYIEDYSCLWVQALKDYYEYTADSGFIKEMFPVMQRLLDWFLEQRTGIGLIKGREFVMVDNPLCYQTCVGATLNAFVYKALVDASFLAGAIQNYDAEKYYTRHAVNLSMSFNTHLWNAEEKTYNDSTDGNPSLHAALISLDRDVVPGDRIPHVRKWLLERYASASDSFSIYTHFWLLKFLFDEYTDENEINALELIKKRYAATYSNENIGFTSGESFQLERPFHNFGSSAAYFLSSNVLGVTIKLPLSENTIMIRPQLGDLKYAKGTVVTEHGMVPVSWRKESDELLFTVIIPETKKAVLFLPLMSPKSSLVIDGKKKPFVKDDNRAVIELSGGRYSGKIIPQMDSMKQ
jgi:hypothetical protein